MTPAPPKPIEILLVEDNPADVDLARDLFRGVGVATELRAVPDGVEVRVWDSTAEMRYLVLPERPQGTQGMSEDELAALVTRDAMIGVARVAPPAAAGAAP